jgi:galactosylceramidase
MNGFLPIVLAGLTLLSVLAPADSSRAGGVNPDETQVIELDGNGPGRVFDGIGGLSAGAASRLLMDYPQPQRSQILDFLFKPDFGAALHDLKVEIGGTVNSTWGAEPSHANTRDELEHPQYEYYDRGYEWWLMEQARKRNPTVILESLQWGAPGWIGGGEYFSQDNADYVAAFIKGAHDYHGLSINYQGIRNEAGYNITWIKTLRNTLDRNGLQAVKLVAADDPGDVQWKIVKDLLADPELSEAVYAAGVHYVAYTSTEAAKAIGKPLWDTEDAEYGHPWGRAKNFARMYNRNYIIGRMTKTIVCTAITSLYENLAPFNVDIWNDPGLMKANTPWSGHYEVPPAIWVTAHTTQFAQPGWRYIDGSCGFLKKAGSYVALRSPDKSGNYSIIIETMNNLPYNQASANVNASDEDTDVSPCLVRFNVKSLSTGRVHVWRSNKAAQFERLRDITPENGSFQIALDGNCIYSLTTTKGQHKGSYNIPKDLRFPFPYKENFESYAPGKMARYFSDQEGTFVVAERADGHGKCLRQIVPKRGIEWFVGEASPWTIVGDKAWKDYEVSVDVHVPDNAFAAVYGRIDAALGRGMPGGYGLTLDSTGAWQLKDTTTVLQSGKVGLTPGAWHNLKLRFSGDQIIAAINGTTVASVMDDFHPTGAVAVASSYDYVEFLHFTVRQIPQTAGAPRLVNLAKGKKATASSNYSDAYSARFANDGNTATRWNAAVGDEAGAWLEVDFGQPTRFNRVTVRQLDIRIEKYKIQYLDGAQWRDVFSGETASDYWSASFAPVQASKVRLLVVSTRNNLTASLFEFAVYDDNN